MSEETKKKPPYQRHPIAIASVIAVMFFGTVYGIAYYFNYAPNIIPILLNPVVAVSVAVVFLLIACVGGVIVLKSKGSDGLFSGVSKADQLNKHQADVIATRMHRNLGYLKRRPSMDGVDYIESGDGEDSYVRIYEKVILPKKDSGRKCILINLEQSVAVDINDKRSIDRAIEEMNDTRFFGEEHVDDFSEARKEYKKNLAGSSPGETEIVHHPDGSVTKRNVSERTVSSPESQNLQDDNDVKAQEG